MSVRICMGFMPRLGKDWAEGRLEALDVWSPFSNVYSSAVGS